MESIENLTRFVRGKVFNCVVRRLDKRWHCAVFIRVFIAASFKGIFGVTNPRYNKRIKRTGLRKHDFATWNYGPEWGRNQPDAGSIGLIQAHFWVFMVCLQGIHKTREHDQNRVRSRTASARFWSHSGISWHVCCMASLHPFTAESFTHGI